MSSDSGDSNTVPSDGDGDGWDESDDCDDADPSVHPEADERCVNSVDDNCDGITDGCSTTVEGADFRTFSQGDDAGLFGSDLAFLTTEAGTTPDLWIMSGRTEIADGRVGAANGEVFPRAIRDAPGDGTWVGPQVATNGDYDANGLDDLVVTGELPGGPWYAWIWSSPVEDGLLPVDQADAIVATHEDAYSFGWTTSVGDLDGSGTTDMFVGSNAHLLMGPVTGVIDIATSPNTFPVPSSARAVGTDFDGDGVLDLVLGQVTVGWPTPEEVRVYPGPIASAPATPDSTWSGDYVGYELVAADFTGDGTDDVFAAACGRFEDPSDLVLLTHESPSGDYVASAEAHLVGVPPDGRFFKLASADFDGNGATDLALGSAYEIDSTGHNELGDGYVAIFTAPFEGTLEIDTGANLLVHGSKGSYGVGLSVAVGDQDGDGLPDVATFSAGTEPNGADLYTVRIFTPALVIDPLL